MGVLGAVEGARWRADRGEGGGVGRGCGGGGGGRDPRVEEIREAALQRGGPLVAAIAQRRPAVRRCQRLEQLRRDAAGIVAAEIDLRPICSITHLGSLPFAKSKP